MNEIKEVFESFGARIRSPYFGYVFFVSLFMNWKAWFYLIFANENVLERFKYFDIETTVYSVIFIPLIIGFFIAIGSPWVRWFFVWAAKSPTTKRNILQANSEHEILDAKNKLAQARSSLQTAEEESLIAQAKRDQEIRTIGDEESRIRLQNQIDELRNSLNNTLQLEGSNSNNAQKSDEIPPNIQTKLLRLISNNSKTFEDDFNKVIDISEFDAQIIIDELLAEGFIQKETDNNGNEYYTTTRSGFRKLEMGDNKQ